MAKWAGRRWFGRPEDATDPETHAAAQAAVTDSRESVRRNQDRAQDVAQETWVLNRELTRNHLAERMEAAMRRVHR